MDIICSDCHKPTEVVYDHATRDTLCSQCGLLLHSANPFFLHSLHHPAPTTNPNPNHNKGTTKSSNKSNHHLTAAFDRLGVISDRLGISALITRRGCEIFKKVFYDDNNAKSCRGRNMDAVLGACLLVACQQENHPRTVKEVCSVVKDGNAAKKDIMKAKNLVTKQLNGDGDGDGLGRTIRACDVIRRFCSNLKITDVRVTKAALEAAAKCEDQVDVRRSPISVAAAVIYIVVQLCGGGGGGRGLKDIVMATDVAEGTIKNTYKDIYPHLSKIVPSWYAGETAINNLAVVP